MANELLLKSRALKLYDYTQVDISAFLDGFVVDEAQYQKDVERILRRFSRKEDAAVVSPGDMVTLSCASELPRYNKTGIPVQVGKGLFNPMLEEALVGMGVGETKTVTLDDGDVAMTVEKAVHSVLPELTDENVAAFGMEDVSSVADLRRFCIEKQVQSFLLEDENPDMASAYVWQELANNSLIERDPDELAVAEAKAEKKLAELKSLPPDDEEGGSEIDEELLKKLFLSELDLAAVGQEMMKQKGELLSVDDYVSWIDKLQVAYPDKTREELEQENSQTDFAISRYGDFLARELDLYVASVYKAHYAKE